MDRSSDGRTDTVNVSGAYVRISLFCHMKLRRSEIGSRLFEAKYVPSFNVRNAQEDIGQMNVSRSGHSAASKRRDQISE